MGIKYLLCWLRRKHKWTYKFAGAKPNYNCEDGDCSISVYDLTCSRCGATVTLGEDELIDCFARKVNDD